MANGPATPELGVPFTLKAIGTGEIHPPADVGELDQSDRHAMADALDPLLDRLEPLQVVKIPVCKFATFVVDRTNILDFPDDFYVRMRFDISRDAGQTFELLGRCSTAGGRLPDGMKQEFSARFEIGPGFPAGAIIRVFIGTTKPVDLGVRWECE